MHVCICSLPDSTTTLAPPEPALGVGVGPQEDHVLHRPGAQGDGDVEIGLAHFHGAENVLEMRRGPLLLLPLR